MSQISLYMKDGMHVCYLVISSCSGCCGRRGVGRCHRSECVLLVRRSHCGHGRHWAVIHVHGVCLFSPTALDRVGAGADLGAVEGYDCAACALLIVILDEGVTLSVIKL